MKKIAPAGLDHVFFTNSGSEAVDTAMKLVLAYHRIKGDSQRTKIISRERSYHGVNIGGTSIGGIVAESQVVVIVAGAWRRPHPAHA